ncbi:uncharacterized protein [Lolium perenne]|uniref:uncharacterized protein isoform X2 n=1 Tax=Lolium perenne TaxID=4522 RepID=UPI003A98D56D
MQLSQGTTPTSCTCSLNRNLSWLAESWSKLELEQKMFRAPYRSGPLFVQVTIKRQYMLEWELKVLVMVHTSRITSCEMAYYQVYHKTIINAE